MVSSSENPYAQYQPYPRTIDDIKAVIHCTLTPHRHLEIVWVGLTGSFSRYQSDVNSDVDLVIGYTVPGQSNQSWDIKELTREFEFLCGRAFDLVYVCDGEAPRMDKAAGAFLSAKTVFEREEGSKWLERNRRLVARVNAQRKELRMGRPRNEYGGVHGDVGASETTSTGGG